MEDTSTWHGRPNSPYMRARPRGRSMGADIPPIQVDQNVEYVRHLVPVCRVAVSNYRWLYSLAPVSHRYYVSKTKRPLALLILYDSCGTLFLVKESNRRSVIMTHNRSASLATNFKRGSIPIREPIRTRTRTFPKDPRVRPAPHNVHVRKNARIKY
jgi:hypothetical protein